MSKEAEKAAKELRSGKKLTRSRIHPISGAIIDALEEMAEIWGKQYKNSSSIPLPTKGKSLHLKRTGKSWSFRIFSSDNGRGSSSVLVRHAPLSLIIEAARALPKMHAKLKEDSVADKDDLLAAYDLISEIERQPES